MTTIINNLSALGAHLREIVEKQIESDESFSLYYICIKGHITSINEEQNLHNISHREYNTIYIGNLMGREITIHFFHTRIINGLLQELF